MRRLPLLTVLLSLALPAAAQAAIHTGHIVFKEPQNPPSIGEPEAPADQSTEYVREILVRYNASAGSLTVEAEAWDPTYWGERLRVSGSLEFGQTAAEAFSVGPKCDELSPPLSGSIVAYPKPTDETPEQELEHSGDNVDVTGGVAGEASLKGYAGKVRPTGSFNGQRFTITFADPAFRNRNWRCVTVEPGLSFGLGEWLKPKPKKKSDHPGQEKAYG
jgi:hypothetical protein